MGVLEGIGLGLVAAFLFYRSILALVLVIPAVIVCVRRTEYREKQKKIMQMQTEFQSAMQSVSGALGAGYSLESAWRYAQADMQRLYGAEAEITMALQHMNRKVGMNEPIEQVLYEFACESGSEDIYNFAEILLYVKRSGGNMTEMIRATVSRIQEKTEILTEIQTAVAAKRAEQRMLMILLPAILLFITLSSPEYMSALYGNPAGVLVMSGCLCGYVIAFFWSEKTVAISV